MSTFTEIIPLVNSVGHSFIQLGAAVPSGIAIDYFFDKAIGATQMVSHKRFLPSPYGSDRIKSPLEAVTSLLVISGQIIVSGLVNALVVKWIGAMESNNADPNFGIIFVIVFFECQARLMARIAQLVEYVNAEFLLAISKSRSIFEPRAAGTDVLSNGPNTQAAFDLARTAKLPAYGI